MMSDLDPSAFAPTWMPEQVGASTRPGNGVPLVLIGAMKAADEALADLGLE